MILKSNYCYQIRRKSDGMISRGGDPPDFGKRGRIWNGSGPLKNHLRAMMSDRRGHETDERVVKYYSNCEVVSVAIIAKPGDAIPDLLPPFPVLDLVSLMRESDKVVKS